MGPTATASLTAPNFDTQLGETFSSNAVSLAFEVAAVPQTGSGGYGPGYLLNGLSSAGFWYQAGLGYDWPTLSGGTYGTTAGFVFLYEVFNATGASIFPSNGGGGFSAFNGSVGAGDPVELSLSFAGSQVSMSALDLRTGATASTSNSSEGASQFVGISGPSNSNGFFSGLMTEEYTSGNYASGQELRVNYTDLGSSVPAATLWGDAFNVTTDQVAWSGSTPSPVDLPTSPELFGWTMQGSVRANATEFVSGYDHAYSVDAIPSGLPFGSIEIVYLSDIGWFPGFPLELPNATYTYLTQPVFAADTSFLGNPNSGTFRVDGALESVPVSYLPSSIGFPVPSVPATIPNGTVGAAYDPTNGLVYFTEPYGDSVLMVNATSRLPVGNITLPSVAWAIGYDAADRSVWVTLPSSGEVAVLSGTSDSVASLVPVGDNPDSIAYDPVDQDMYVGNAGLSNQPGSNNITVLNGSTTTIQDYLPYPNGQDGIGVDLHHRYVYLSSFGNGNLTVLNASTNAFVAQVPLPAVGVLGARAGGGAMAYDSANDQIYVTNWSEVPLGSSGSVQGFSDVGNTVWAFNGTQLVANIPVGNDPVSVVVDPANRIVYADSFSFGWMVPINGSTDQDVFNPPSNLSEWYVGLQLRLGPIIGGQSYGLAFDPSTREIFAAVDASNHSVGVFSIPFRVNFSEQGLPPGDSWAVSLEGYNASSSAASLAFWAVAEPIHYQVTAPAGFVASPSNGTVTVSGANVTIPLTFLRAYAVSFVEGGLPAGSSWSVTIGNQSVLTDLSTCSVLLANGTYGYRVGLPSGWLASPFLGTLEVAGSTQQVMITISPPPSPRTILLGIYATRSDLQAAFPSAGSNLTSFAGLVSWASSVSAGSFPDSNYSTFAAPAAGYYFALMELYNARPDLRQAFPLAYENSSSYARLVTWAAEVVQGAISDSANATLRPWGYAYGLLGVYATRTDLQATMPNATSNLTSFEALANWAGGVVSGAWNDSANASLQPFGYWYVLMRTYDGRPDLEGAFPNAWENETDFTGLVSWAGGVVTQTYADSAYPVLRPFGYWYDLMGVYNGRADLQGAFPYAYANATSYQALLQWADGVVRQLFPDSAYPLLDVYATYYEANG